MKIAKPCHFSDVEVNQEFTCKGKRYTKLDNVVAGCDTGVRVFDQNEPVEIFVEAKPTGGPIHHVPGLHKGLTVRDYFFIHILQGMLSQPGMTLDIDGDAVGEKRVQLAYGLADTAIKERSK